MDIALILITPPTQLADLLGSITMWRDLPFVPREDNLSDVAVVGFRSLDPKSICYGKGHVYEIQPRRSYTGLRYDLRSLITSLLKGSGGVLLFLSEMESVSCSESIVV
jgi:hypothetical protein